jgi:restriction system protein
MSAESSPANLSGKRYPNDRRARGGKGPQFLRFVVPIIESLRSLGGSGTAQEAVEAVITAVGIPEREQGITLRNGTSRVVNQVHWARFYLAKDSYLRSSQHGVWTSLKKG